MTSRRQAWLDRLITWSPVLLLGALAALTYWLNAQVQVSGPSFDSSGRIRQALVAKRAQHYPDDDTTTLDAPEIAFTDPDKPRLDVTADHAKITGDREHAYFEGHVKAVREASTDAEGKTEGPVTFVSEFLHVIPKEDRIVTDRPVTITDPRGTINSTGLEYDNKAKTLKLRSRVSGQLQPQSKSP